MAEDNKKEDKSLLDPNIENRLESLGLSFISEEELEENLKSKQQEPIQSNTHNDPFAHLDGLGLSLVKEEPAKEIVKPKSEKIKKNIEDQLKSQQTEKNSKNIDEEDDYAPPDYKKKQFSNKQVIQIVLGIIVAALILRLLF